MSAKGAYGPRADLGAITDEWFRRIERHELREHALAVRDLVRSTVPNARESIKWGLPCWDQDGGLCAVSVHGKGAGAYAKIQFWEAGVEIDDPGGLLEGTGKRCRHVKLPLGEKLPRGALRDLIRSAARFNKRSRSD